MYKNKAESRWLHKAVKAKPKQCYANASLAVMGVDDYAESVYVEGYVSREGVIIEHGWLEKNGAIIDPTLPEEDLVYFAGLRFSGQQALCRAMTLLPKKSGCEDLPLFYRFGWGGGESPEFRQAWEQALAYSNSLIGQRTESAGGGELVGG